MSNFSRTGDLGDTLTFQQLMDAADTNLPFGSDVPRNWNYIPPPLDPLFPTSASATSELWTPHTVDNEVSLFPPHELFETHNSYDCAQDIFEHLLVPALSEMPASSSQLPTVEIQSSSDVATGPAILEAPQSLESFAVRHHGDDDFALTWPVLSPLPEIPFLTDQPAFEQMGKACVLRNPSPAQSFPLPQYTGRIDESTCDLDGEGSEYNFYVAAPPNGLTGGIADWIPLLSPLPSIVPEPLLVATRSPATRERKPSRKAPSGPKPTRQGKPYGKPKATGASDPLMQQFRDDLQILLTAEILLPPAPGAHYKVQRVLAYADSLCFNNAAALDAQLRAQKNSDQKQCSFLSPTDVTFERCKSRANDLRRHRLTCHPVYERNAETGEDEWVYNLGSVRGTVVKDAKIKDGANLATEAQGIPHNGWFVKRGQRRVALQVNRDDESEGTGAM